jgi:hypothetical protein
MNKTLVILASVLAIAICTGIGEWPLARVTLQVVDEGGQPVAGVDAIIGFEKPEHAPGQWGSAPVVTERGKTDSEGLFSASRRGGNHVTVAAHAPGYYSCEGKPIDFVESAAGKWQPWNPRILVVLRKIVNPIPMYAKHVNLGAPEMNKPVGYDLVIGDWLAPHGKGKSGDIWFRQDLEQRDGHDFDYTLRVSFPNSGDGIQVFSPIETSDLKSPRTAPDDGYEREWLQTRYVRPNSPEKSTRDEKRCYFVRIRTVLDSNAKVVSANYGKVYGDFMNFTYYLNPEMNSRNMEFDPHRNLFGELKGAERASKP